MDVNQYQSQPLTRERKVGFLFLLLFAIMTVGLGVLQLRNTIYGPFVVRGADKDDENFVLADETTRLQQIDTDRDGINDYEELYFYETSPYIEDTDSDGVQDKVELDEGGDPLCPKGQDCSGADITSDTPDKTQIGTSIGGSISNPADQLFGINGFGPSSTAPTFDLEALVKDPDALRKVLLSTGKITADALAQFSDEQLLQMVQGVLQTEPITNQQPAPDGSQ